MQMLVWQTCSEDSALKTDFTSEAAAGHFASGCMADAAAQLLRKAHRP